MWSVHFGILNLIDQYIKFNIPVDNLKNNIQGYEISYTNH